MGQLIKNTVGMNRHTGKFLKGTEYLEQSLAVLFTTFQGERVYRRDLGIDPTLIDRPIEPNLITEYVYNMATALETAEETRFELDQGFIAGVNTNGQLEIGFIGNNLESNEGLEQVLSFA